MKKVIFVLAVCVLTAIVSCKSNTSSVTSVSVDSSTVIETPVDSMHVSDSSIVDTLKK
tara:strand:+ start:229 stop:402 length:174 start_codon:yes stop_codon:yes gene_type:complete